MANVDPDFVPAPDAAGVVIQEEPRYEVMGEVGPYMVMEVDENGAVLSTAYYADHDEAVEFANVIVGEGEVQDDTEDVGSPIVERYGEPDDESTDTSAEA